MVLRGARGAGFIHGGASMERGLLRGGGRVSRRRRDWYHPRENCCMPSSKRQRVHSHWCNVADFGFSESVSRDDLSSSSDEFAGCVSSRRKSILDDALFEFFKKEAIKSLKSDFSTFCMGSDVWKEPQKAKFFGIDKSCFTIYAAKYFFEVLHRLSDEQKLVVDKAGFSCLLHLGKTHIPSQFTRWLACCVDPDSSQIIIDDKILNISKDSIHFVLGLPNCGDELVENSDGGAEFIKSLFHLSELPHITFFGDKLKSSEPLSDQQIFVCFMQIAVSCFLCPSANNYLDTKFTRQLGDFERAKTFDFCQLVYKYLISGIRKTLNFIKEKGRKPKSFEFCSFALDVYYLDSLDFGAHVAGRGLPRAVSWSGDMVQKFSELDRRTKRCFGRRRIRTDLHSCYLDIKTAGSPNGMSSSTHCEPLSTNQKQFLHEKFRFTLSVQIVDGICDTIQACSSHQWGNNNMFSLAQNILHFIANSRNLFNDSNELPKGIDGLATPIGLTSNPVPKNSNITAPVLHPVVKVKSRLALCVPEVPENRCADFCQSDLISPIGRINLSPASPCKDATKLGGSSVSKKLLPIPSKGSHQDPIPVVVTTPKCIPVHNSPEVTITGMSTFKDRQQKLAMDADAVYNKTVHPAPNRVVNPVKIGGENVQSVPEVFEVVDLENVTHKRTTSVNGFITLQPKNSLVLPLAHNSRYAVTDDDIMHYCAIIELAYTERIQKNYALIYHGVHCNFVSLGQTLMPDGHIDNFLIPCFCRKLFEDNHPSKSGRHYFFPYIGESILELSSSSHESLVRTSFLGAATASKGKRLELSDSLFFPICHSDHWFTFVVSMKWRLFIFLDSFYGPKSEYQLAVRDPLIKNFITLWRKIFNSDEIEFKKFQVMIPNMPRQGNPHDCGVFQMKVLEVFDPAKDLRKVFSKEDISHIRIQYANSLFFHTGNKADSSLVTNYYVKDDFMRQQLR